MENPPFSTKKNLIILYKAYQTILKLSIEFEPETSMKKGILSMKVSLENTCKIRQ